MNEPQPQPESTHFENGRRVTEWRLDEGVWRRWVYGRDEAWDQEEIERRDGE